MIVTSKGTTPKTRSIPLAIPLAIPYVSIRWKEGLWSDGTSEIAGAASGGIFMGGI